MIVEQSIFLFSNMVKQIEWTVTIFAYAKCPFHVRVRRSAAIANTFLPLGSEMLSRMTKRSKSNTFPQHSCFITPRYCIFFIVKVSSLFADWLGFTHSSTWPEVVGNISRRLHGLVQDRLKKARQNYARMSRDFCLPRQLNANSSQSPKLLMVAVNHGRLGNYMFRVASLVALARRHGYTPVYLQRDERARLFAGLNVEVLTKAQALSLAHQTTFPEIKEQGAGIFDEDIANFPVKHGPGQSVIVADYLQASHAPQKKFQIISNQNK